MRRLVWLGAALVLVGCGGSGLDIFQTPTPPLVAATSIPAIPTHTPIPTSVIPFPPTAPPLPTLTVPPIRTPTPLPAQSVVAATTAPLPTSVPVTIAPKPTAPLSAIPATESAASAPLPTLPPIPTIPPKPTNTAKPPTVAPLAGWIANAPLTNENVSSALKATQGIPRSVDLSNPKEIFVSPDLGFVRVTYRANSNFSETDLLSIAANTTFSVYRTLFANPNVKRADVEIYSDWTDVYGKTAEAKSTGTRLERATVDSRIDWTGLEDRVIVDNKIMFCVADTHYIHPSILARLKDRGCLGA